MANRQTIAVPDRRLASAADSSASPGALREVFLPAAIGSLLLFAAMPPLGWGWLGWIAPAFWLHAALKPSLPRRSYAALWLAGMAFWIPVLHWLRLPHPATSVGWLALSIYLAFYVPVLVALVRVASARFGVPAVVAAPIIWVGLEKAMAHLLTGFSMVTLAHTQYDWLPLIQIADLAGFYAVSFVVMTVAALLATAWQRRREWKTWLQSAPCWAATGWTAALLVASLSYGYWRLSQPATTPGPRIALVQGSIDTEIKSDPGMAQRVFDEYIGLSQQVRREAVQLDLIVWPETMYREPLLTVAENSTAPPDAEWTIDQWRQQAEVSRTGLARLAALLDAPLLLGIDRVHCGDGVLQNYNSSVHVSRDGEVLGHYDKMHPVLFGEYVPLARRFPWLYKFTPLAGGIYEGEQAVAFEVGGAGLSVSICYENVLAHLIRGQVAELADAGNEPELLVNLTNDGWFWGSSELDLHLICAVYRAVECRKPMLIAANTGFSAWIDSSGRIVEQGPRRATGWIVADTRLDSRRSLYVAWGDLPALAALACCVMLTAVGIYDRRRRAK